MLKTFVDRLYKINNTLSGFDNDLEETKSILQKNIFPHKLIDKVVRNYLSDQYISEESLSKKEGRYYKLPYVGFFSRHAHNKIKGITKKLCKDQVSVNLVFIPYKIGSMFLTKDKISFFLKPVVVYKFVCASCNPCYVGETARHLPTRIKEQLKTDKKLHIYQHLSSNQNCFNCCTDNCFSILGYALTKYQLKIKEVLT